MIRLPVCLVGMTVVAWEVPMGKLGLRGAGNTRALEKSS